MSNPIDKNNDLRCSKLVDCAWSRRDFIKNSVAGMCAVIAGCRGAEQRQIRPQPALSRSRQAEADKKSALPNLLFIITDDQPTFTLKSYGENQMAYSPGIDKLAAEGVVFTQAYCSSPQCVPSRRSIATGQYPHHTGVYTFEKTHAWHDSFHPFWWAQLKNRQHYRTALVGKEHLLYKWHWIPLPGQKMSRYLRQYNIHPREMIPDDYLPFWRYRTDVDPPIFQYDLVDGSWRITETYLLPESEDERYGLVRGYRRLRKDISKVIFAGYNERNSGDLIDDWTLRDFEALLVNHATDCDYNERVPLAVELGFKFAHSPITPPREIAQKFEKLDFEIPEFTDREKAEILAVPQMKELYTSLRSDGMTNEEIKKMWAHMFAFCAYGDDLIGRAVDAFKTFSEQQKRPWLIIYTSDQGAHIHHHGMIEKFTMYDVVVRVPLIIASSDKDLFPPGMVYDDLVEQVDIAPTLLAFAGEDLSEKRYGYLDGFNVADIIHGRIPKREEVLVQSSHICGHRALLRTKEYAFSMRTRPPDDRYEFGKNYDWACKASVEEVEMTLFDLRNDPKQLHNVAGRTEYKEVRDLLRKRLQERVLGSDRVEYPWHQDTGQHPPFFEPTAHLYQGD